MTVLIALLVLTGLWLVGPGNIGRMVLGIGLRFESRPPTLPLLTDTAILIFSKTNGLRDDVQIKAANTALENLARAKGFHILVTLDEASYAPREIIPFIVEKDLRMGRDRPVVWTHCVGNGRAFYSALRHPATACSEPRHLAMIAGAISWAAGLEGTKCVADREVLRLKD